MGGSDDAGNGKRKSGRKRGEGRRWPKGTSGNPRGGAIRTPLELREAMRGHTPEAVATLLSLMRHATPDSVRRQAASDIIDRAWGKATERVEMTGADGAPLTGDDPITLLIRRMAAAKDPGPGGGG